MLSNEYVNELHSDGSGRDRALKVGLGPGPGLSPSMNAGPRALRFYYIHLSDVPMTAPSNFERLVMVFLRIKNGSNLERSLLSTIQSYDANGRKSKKILITLIISNHHCYTVRD